MDRAAIQGMVAEIKEILATRDRIRIMEVCGTHTMAIARAGIKKLLPEDIQLVSGPGCPVCVTDQGDIDRALSIALLPDVIMTTFGDMIRVPGTETSLQEAKQKGADVRVVYSCMDALEVAEKNKDKNVVFMGVGFETTSPTIAATVLEAKRRRLKNFFIQSLKLRSKNSINFSLFWRMGVTDSAKGCCFL